MSQYVAQQISAAFKKNVERMSKTMTTEDAANVANLTLHTKQTGLNSLESSDVTWAQPLACCGREGVRAGGGGRADERRACGRGT